MQDRYVDVDAAAGGDGTTAALSGANCAYKSLAIAIAALSGVTLGEPYRIICGSNHANHTADTSAATVSGFTASATNTLTITTDAGSKASTSWSVNKYQLLAKLTGSTAYVIVDGLQIKPPAANNAISSSGYGLKIYNCLIRMVLSTSAGITGYGYTCYNTIVYGGSGSAFYHSGGSYSMAINCVGISTTYAFRAGTGNFYVRNCYGRGTTAAFDAVIQTTNAAADATSEGAGSLSNVVYSVSAGAYFVNVTAASENFALQESSDLVDAGTNYSGTFTYDIDGKPRGTLWDMGAYELIQYEVLEGIASGVGTAVGTLAGQLVLVGSSSGVGSVVGALAKLNFVAGISVAVSSVVGDLRGINTLLGAAAGLAESLGALGLFNAVVGFILGTSSATGDLVVHGRTSPLRTFEVSEEVKTFLVRREQRVFNITTEHRDRNFRVRS
jgi:hypothetical protein